MNVSLKEIRCPSFSVSTSTPSQSKRSALGRPLELESEEAEMTAMVHPFRRLLLPIVVAAILNVLVEKTLPEENKRDGVLRSEVDGYGKMLLLSGTIELGTTTTTPEAIALLDSTLIKK